MKRLISGALRVSVCGMTRRVVVRDRGRYRFSRSAMRGSRARGVHGSRTAGASVFGFITNGSLWFPPTRHASSDARIFAWRKGLVSIPLLPISSRPKQTGQSSRSSQVHSNSFELRQCIGEWNFEFVRTFLRMPFELHSKSSVPRSSPSTCCVSIPNRKLPRTWSM